MMDRLLNSPHLTTAIGFFAATLGVLMALALFIGLFVMGTFVVEVIS